MQKIESSRGLLVIISFISPGKLHVIADNTTQQEIKYSTSFFLFSLLVPVSQIQAVWCHVIHAILCIVFYARHQIYHQIVLTDTPAFNISTQHSNMSLSRPKLALIEKEVLQQSYQYQNALGISQKKDLRMKCMEKVYMVL
jgi:hypothetical protein